MLNFVLMFRDIKNFKYLCIVIKVSRYFENGIMLNEKIMISEHTVKVVNGYSVSSYTNKKT